MIGSIARVLAGSLLGLAVLFSGPRSTVVCGHARWPDSMFGDTFGHTDGVDFTGCAVPTPLAWTLAGVVAAGPSVAPALTRHRRG